MRRRSLHCLLILPSVVALGLCPVNAAPELTADGSRMPVRSEEGKVLLEWEDAGGIYRLEHAREAAFTAPLIRYAGPDRASLVTGLVEGEHHFRVGRLPDAAATELIWSNPVRVDVEYVDARLVVALMSVGCLLFFATVGAVLIGHRRHAATNALGKESA